MLRQEIARVFLDPSSRPQQCDPMAREVSKCVLLTVREAGLALPDETEDLTRWLGDGPGHKAEEFLRHRRFDESVATPENVKFLVSHIRGDFLEQRSRAAKVQMMAVEQAAQKRITKSWQVQAAPRTPREVLREAVAELDAELGLLPEVKSRLEVSY